MNHDTVDPGPSELVLDLDSCETAAHFQDSCSEAVSLTFPVGLDRLALEFQVTIQRRHDLLIGERTSEAVCFMLASGEVESMELKGRCLEQGIPRISVVNQHDLTAARLSFLEPLFFFLRGLLRYASAHRTTPIRMIRVCGPEEQQLEWLDAELVRLLGEHERVHGGNSE
jgi:hypothetical protein